MRTAALLVLPALLAACALTPPVAGPGPAHPGPAAALPVAVPTVGVLLPLSGPLAEHGHAAEAAMRLALAAVPEPDRPAWEVVDTRGEPLAAVRAAERLALDEDAVALLALADAPTAEPLAVLADRLQVPLVVFGTGSEAALAGPEYAFRVGPSDSLLATAAGRWAARVADEGAVAVVVEAEQPRSRRAAAAFRAASGLPPARVPRVDAYGGEDAASAAALAALTDAPLRLAYLAGPPKAWAPLLDLVDRARLAVPRLVAVDGPLPTPARDRLAAAAAAGPVWAVVPFHAEASPAARAFAASFRAATGSEADAAAALAYDAMQAVLAALQRVPLTGDLAAARAALRHALLELPVAEGVTGRVGFAGEREGSREAHAVHVEVEPDGTLRWRPAAEGEGVSAR